MSSIPALLTSSPVGVPKLYVLTCKNFYTALYHTHKVLEPMSILVIGDSCTVTLYKICQVSI